jgi:hypothetical protein
MYNNLEKEIEKTLNNLDAVNMSNKLKAQVLLSVIKSLILSEKSFVIVRGNDSTKTS